MAKIMAGAAHANIFHHLNGQGLFIHLNAANTAQTLPQHIIVDNQTIKTKPKQ